VPIKVHIWYVSEPCWLSGGPDSGRAPVFGLIAANMVESAFLVGRRSFVDTNWVGTAMPISPVSEFRLQSVIGNGGVFLAYQAIRLWNSN
jgi:hypothetical protein